jgi:poly-gamma-glutamate synthesis protein (capsule biosynthesis protein)
MKILPLLLTASLAVGMPVETSLDMPYKEVTISFAGDCTLGEYKGQSAGNQFHDYYVANGADYFFQNVKSIFESDDITLVNLEGPLTNHTQTVDKTYPIKCEPEHVACLTNSSIEAVNLANNHIYDCGQKGFEDTKNTLDANGIGYCGEETTYTTIKNGVKVTFLGYRGFSATSELKTKIRQDIEDARTNRAEIVCVSFHFGEEHVNYSNSTQEELARYAVDCGADIVIGTHPHVIQGIEVYNGKTICYSLGNFSFGANKNPTDKDTFIYQQTFRIYEDGTVEYRNQNIIPCSVSSSTTTNNYQPTPLEGTRVLERLKTYSSKYNNTLDALK